MADPLRRWLPAMLLIVLALLVGVIVWLVRRNKPPAVGRAPGPGPLPQAPGPGKTEVFRPATIGGSLLCLSGPVQGQVFPVGQGVYLGRDASRAQIVVHDTQVSGLHVWVGSLAGRVLARDAGSTNGTFLNDPTGPRMAEAELKPGDRLILGPKGTIVFEYRA